eukprot:SAG31_NODE_2415_length_5732_cov_7.567016_3_plen_67_part_00
MDTADGGLYSVRIQLYTCDTFSISALHLAIKVPYFSHSGHKNEKVTNYLVVRHQLPGGGAVELVPR